METIKEEIKKQIQKIKDEVKSLTDQVEESRTEGGEDNFGITDELQGKLNLLTDKIDNLQRNLSIYQNASFSKSITVGHVVELKSKSSTKTRNITLVLPEDADPTKGYISFESPLGKALVGKKVGEKINFESPVGIQEFNVIKAK